MAIGEPSSTTVLINNLDASNPLHVQNSDSSSSVLFPFKLIDAYASSDVLSAQWDRCNAMVLTWIMNDVSQEVYMALVYSNNVASVWKELNENYNKVDGSVREFDPITKLPKYTYDVKCSCDASKELLLHQQLMKLMQFLMGLDNCYQPVGSALLTRDPLPNVKDAYTTVSRGESHKGIPESFGVTESKINSTSFAAKSFNNNIIVFNNNNNTRGHVNNSNSRGPNTNLNFNANIDVKGNDKQQPACNTPSSFTVYQMRKLLNLINDAPSGSIHANMAGKGTFFNGNVWFNINFSRYYYANFGLVVKTITMGWIIDSGANQHLTMSTVGIYNVVDISSLKITVGHPNGTLATISHVETVKLSKNVILYDVLVVPGNYGVLGNINMEMSFILSKDLWHNRLGHPADQVLTVLKSDLNLSKITKVSVCETCHGAKQTREPFPLSDHKSKRLGELVRLDLWDPYRVTSKERFKYFFTIVDVYSRAVWFI
ncbi:ribonuclease H-like domain-containing protein [Tanacetum coccineum]